MDDELGRWAEHLAQIVAPDETQLAPGIVEAFVAGGKSRRELTRSATSMAAGFDPAAGYTLLPMVLSAIAGSGSAVLAILGKNLGDVPELLNSIADGCGSSAVTARRA